MFSEYGEDLPGDLLVGERAQERWWHLTPSWIPKDAMAAYFEERARAALAGEAPGSSVGGEQPQFMGTLWLPNGQVLPVVVKLSPPRGTSVADRWADLLAAEAIALSLWQDTGFPAVVPPIVDGSVRRFLVSPRLDRVGAAGRRGVLSLGALGDSDLYDEVSHPSRAIGASGECGGFGCAPTGFWGLEYSCQALMQMFLFLRTLDWASRLSGIALSPSFCLGGGVL